ncbi:hypothetical protein TSAR_000998, partial [Trichomalopsis sarcophagae]
HECSHTAYNEARGVNLEQLDSSLDSSVGAIPTLVDTSQPPSNMSTSPANWDSMTASQQMAAIFARVGAVEERLSNKIDTLQEEYKKLRKTVANQNERIVALGRPTSQGSIVGLPLIDGAIKILAILDLLPLKSDILEVRELPNKALNNQADTSSSQASNLTGKRTLVVHLKNSASRDFILRTKRQHGPIVLFDIVQGATSDPINLYEMSSSRINDLRIQAKARARKRNYKHVWNIDVLSVCETWLAPDLDATVAQNDGYQVAPNDRGLKSAKKRAFVQGGELGIENGERFLFSSVYRRPQGHVLSQFFLSLLQFMSFYSNLIIAGDFNSNLLDPSNYYGTHLKTPNPEWRIASRQFLGYLARFNFNK